MGNSKAQDDRSSSMTPDPQGRGAQGKDPGPAWSVEAQVAEDLLGLVQQVRNALQPVEPRAEFIESLKGTLDIDMRRPRRLNRPREHALLWVALGLGGTAYLVGMAALSVRGISTLLGAVAILFGIRESKRARSKVRLAH